uniref:Uncharacterized protein n=1 Tax=Geospiza parvula TaxID=87175 RepID=A0A8C3MU45_GEOPR
PHAKKLENDGDWCGFFQIDGLEEKLARCRQSMEEVDLKLRKEKLSPEGRYSAKAAEGKYLCLCC